MVRSSIALPTLAVMLTFGLTSCGSAGSVPGEPLPEQTVMNDPALEAAAEAARPWLEESFSDSFAGIELDHGEQLMIVYRRPDPRLDAELAERVRDVRFVTRDATFSIAEMTATIDQVLADEGYWHDLEMPITGVAPAADGSGVQVFTSGDPQELSTALAERYPDMAFDVRRQVAVFPVFTSPPPPFQGPVPTGRATIDPRPTPTE
jgi:hypothetical protein